jgi:exodeoxyribonuclease VII large subunit
MDIKVPSVTQLVSQIKRNLEGSFRNVNVVGEITNLSGSSSGHWYLSLSDESSLISAALFKMDAMRNPIIRNLKDGDKVMCSGAISVYAKRGTFQLIIKRITPVGKGDLKEKFEQLKKRLAAEGLFDISVKKKIPALPKRVAVITAPGAAALQDFLNIIKRRSHYYDILLSGALVQGQTAPASIRKALERIIRYNMKMKEEGHTDKAIDVIVMTRGGGSLEDLWAFNDEALAWDIYNCPIPVISAVGHQVDFSISDFVADLRCETPSAAAEVLTNSQKEISERLKNNRSLLLSYMRQKLSHEKRRLQEISPKSLLDKMWTRLHDYQKRLHNLNLISRRNELIAYQEYAYEIDHKLARLVRSMENTFQQAKNKVDGLNSVLAALNPKNVLERGYAYTEIDGDVLSTVDEFEKIGDKIFNIHLLDGVVKAKKVGKNV